LWKKYENESKSSTNTQQTFTNSTNRRYSLLEERLSLYHIVKTNRRRSNKIITHIYETDGRKKTLQNKRNILGFYKESYEVLRVSLQNMGSLSGQLQRKILTDKQENLGASITAEVLRTAVKQEAINTVTCTL
jgi:hypothetical protein